MYKVSSTSFGYIEKVEDQVLESCTAESGGGPCTAESGDGGGGRRRSDDGGNCHRVAA
jgi:hypothetical protein